MREYFQFRFFDPLRRRWIMARYRAELHVIAERYEKWEVIGAPELRPDGPLQPCSFPMPRPSAP